MPTRKRLYRKAATRKQKGGVIKTFSNLRAKNKSDDIFVSVRFDIDSQKRDYKKEKSTDKDLMSSMSSVIDKVKVTTVYLEEGKRRFYLNIDGLYYYLPSPVKFREVKARAQLSSFIGTFASRAASAAGSAAGSAAAGAAAGAAFTTAPVTAAVSMTSDLFAGKSFAEAKKGAAMAAALAIAKAAFWAAGRAASYAVVEEGKKMLIEEAEKIGKKYIEIFRQSFQKLYNRMPEEHEIESALAAAPEPLLPLPAPKLDIQFAAAAAAAAANAGLGPAAAGVGAAGPAAAGAGAAGPAAAGAGAAGPAAAGAGAAAIDAREDFEISPDLLISNDDYEKWKRGLLPGLNEFFVDTGLQSYISHKITEKKVEETQFTNLLKSQDPQQIYKMFQKGDHVEGKHLFTINYQANLYKYINKEKRSQYYFVWYLNSNKTGIALDITPDMEKNLLKEALPAGKEPPKVFPGKGYKLGP